MIPFATPRNREIINLLQIVRVTQETDEGKFTVHFTNGDSQVYEGDAAKFLNTEIAFALNMYRQFQVQSQSNIVTPDAGRIM